MRKSAGHDFCSLVKDPWNAIYTQGGVLEISKRPSIMGCSVPHLLVLSGTPIWIYVEDSSMDEEIDLGLKVSVDEKFGRKDHEILFRPPRVETIDFPAYCRMDLFLNEKLSFARIIKGGEDEQLSTGLVLTIGKNCRLGIFIDEDIPINLLLTTNDRSIDILCTELDKSKHLPNRRGDRGH